MKGDIVLVWRVGGELGPVMRASSEKAPELSAFVSRDAHSADCHVTVLWPRGFAEGTAETLAEAKAWAEGVAKAWLVLRSMP